MPTLPLPADHSHCQRTSSPRVYLRIRPLPPELSPSFVTRHGNVTILTCDAMSSRFAVTVNNLDILDPDEVNVIRAGFGMPKMGEPMAEEYADDVPVLLYVPPALRVPGEPAIQGGEEAERRVFTEQLCQELQMLRAELVP